MLRADWRIALLLDECGPIRDLQPHDAPVGRYGSQGAKCPSPTPKLDTGDPQSPPPAAQEKIVPDDRFVLAELALVGCGFACHGRPPGGFQRMNLLKTGNHAGPPPYLYSALPAAQSCGKYCCVTVIMTLSILSRSTDVAFGIYRVEAIHSHSPPAYDGDARNFPENREETKLMNHK